LFAFFGDEASMLKKTIDNLNRIIIPLLSTWPLSMIARPVRHVARRSTPLTANS
jgi:hypothetical protein